MLLFRESIRDQDQSFTSLNLPQRHPAEPKPYLQAYPHTLLLKSTLSMLSRVATSYYNFDLFLVSFDGGIKKIILSV